MCVPRRIADGGEPNLHQGTVCHGKQLDGSKLIGYFKRSSTTSKKSNMAKSNRSGVFRMDAHPFFWFGQILGLRNRVLNQELRRHGLDYPRLKVLGVLQEHSGCSMQELAELAAVDRTSLNHTVWLLVEEGLVDRKARPSDRRSIVLSLTAAGRKMFKRISPMILHLNERTMTGFSAKETAAFLEQLRRMADNLRDKP
jgi:DNA-binding MarR family transcriptional regulator